MLMSGGLVRLPPAWAPFQVRFCRSRMHGILSQCYQKHEEMFSDSD
jgi:hypothetical protein